MCDTNFIISIKTPMELFKNSDINLKELEEFLQDIPIYLVGSRYLGIETAKSDYDFLLQYTPFRLQKLANILKLKIEKYTAYSNNSIEYDVTKRVREFENTEENNLIYTALTFEFETYNNGLAYETKAHFIFTYYLDELLEVYEHCRNKRLFSKETNKSARIDVFNLLTSRKKREILQRRPQAFGLLDSESIL